MPFAHMMPGLHGRAQHLAMLDLARLNFNIHVIACAT